MKPKQTFNRDNLHFLELEDQLRADAVFLNDPLTQDEIRGNIAAVVFAQNCYAMAMMYETDPFKRAAIFALFSGNGGTPISLGMWWMKFREELPLNTPKLRMAIIKTQKLFPIDFFAQYFREDDLELPETFRKEFKNRKG